MSARLAKGIKSRKPGEQVEVEAVINRSKYVSSLLNQAQQGGRSGNRISPPSRPAPSKRPQNRPAPETKQQSPARVQQPAQTRQNGAAQLATQVTRPKSPVAGSRGGSNGAGASGHEESGGRNGYSAAHAEEEPEPEPEEQAAVYSSSDEEDEGEGEGHGSETDWRREQILSELLETEKTYVAQLKALEELYIKPLQAENKAAGKDKEGSTTLALKNADAIFYNVLLIGSMNAGLAESLEKRLGSRSGAGLAQACVGDLLVEFVPLFQLYKDYTVNHVRANPLIVSLLDQRDSGTLKFREFCAQAKEDPRAKGLNLSSLLITPIQRVPRYKLLLADLVKTTPSDHADKADLDKAYDLICKAALDINEAVRLNENQALLLDMEKEIFSKKVKLVKPGPLSQCPQFLRKGNLTKVCRRDDKEFFFFLFSHLLIYGHPGIRKFKVSRQITINRQFRIEPYTSDRLKNSLTIFSEHKSFIVYAKDDTEMQAWTTDLQKCVEIHNPTGTGGGHALKPVWVADKESKSCNICSAKFTLLTRRHHCRRCGELCCSACSKARLDLDAYRGKNASAFESLVVVAGRKPEKGKVRVCKRCVSQLAEAGLLSGDGGGEMKVTVADSEAAATAVSAITTRPAGESTSSIASNRSNTSNHSHKATEVSISPSRPPVNIAAPTPKADPAKPRGSAKYPTAPGALSVNVAVDTRQSAAPTPHRPVPTPVSRPAAAAANNVQPTPRAASPTPRVASPQQQTRQVQPQQQQAAPTPRPVSPKPQQTQQNGHSNGSAARPVAATPKASTNHVQQPQPQRTQAQPQQQQQQKQAVRAASPALANSGSGSRQPNGQSASSSAQRAASPGRSQQPQPQPQQQRQTPSSGSGHGSGGQRDSSNHNRALPVRPTSAGASSGNGSSGGSSNSKAPMQRVATSPASGGAQASGGSGNRPPAGRPHGNHHRPPPPMARSATAGNLGGKRSSSSANSEWG